MTKTMRALISTTAMVVAVAMTGSANAADVKLKASHQWPGGKGDPRDEMVQIIAREVAAADVGLEVQVYPGASLFKPRSEEHTYEIQALMRITYAVFCLKKKNKQ